MRRDLEKMKELFDELGISYTVEGNIINIGDESIDCYKGSFGKALSIKFSDEGKFIGFDPWGE